MKPAIQAKFQLSYGHFQLAVDLQLPAHGVSVLFGPSGSGKTTLLRCIAGLQRPQQGWLTINQQRWQDSSQQLFIPTHQRNLGYVFQDANLFPHLSVQDNLHYGLKRSNQNAEHLPAILHLLGIDHLLSRMPAHLSGGEKQRVAIARALALNPDILLMDEPLAALDDARKQEILPYLICLHQQLQIPVLYVTHSRQEVAQLADYLVLMDAGQVIANGPLDSMLARLDLPLAASSVWQVTVLQHEHRYQLSQVGFVGGELSLSQIAAPVGSQLRLQIDARDVSISLQQATASSILNILPATITGIREQDNGHCLVRLQVGPQTLLADITQKSLHLLGLRLDMQVFAQIKGTSLLSGTGHRNSKRLLTDCAQPFA